MNYEYIIKALIQAQDYINKANDSELPAEMREQLDKIVDDIDWIRYDIEDMEKEGK